MGLAPGFGSAEGVRREREGLSHGSFGRLVGSALRVSFFGFCSFPVSKESKKKRLHFGMPGQRFAQWELQHRA